MRALFLLLLVAGLGRFARAAESRTLEARDLLTAVTIGDVRFAPKGDQVLFETHQVDERSNSYRTCVWVTAAQGTSGPPRLVSQQDFNNGFQSSFARWSADGEAVIYVAVRDGRSQARRYSLAQGTDDLLFGDLGTPADPRSLPPDSFRLSPDEKTLAVVLPEPARPADPNRGAVAKLRWPYGQGTPNAGLWLKELPAGELRRVTPADLHVSEFAWSPDGSRIAFSAAPAPEEAPYKNDLYVLVVATSAIKPVVSQPGWDREPVWSPDGRRIAFVSQRGTQDWNYNSWVGIVSVDGGKPDYPFVDFQSDSGSAPRELAWTPDGLRVLFSTGYHLDRAIFAGTPATRQVERLTPEGTFVRAASLSPDGRRLAVATEGVTTPSELDAVDLPWRNLRRLTRLNASLSDIRMPHAERLTWRSRDDRFDVHGIVITPPDIRPGAPRPTILYLAGGPSMVRNGFDLDEEVFPHLLLAAKGYVVFAPNTRGRRGYGAAFLQAMPEKSDFMPGPWDDAVAGLDELVRLGMADPARLGIAGFSYGGGLAVYGAAHSTRFKAAAVFEGFANTLRQSLRAAGLENGRLLTLHQRGLGVPWQPESFAALLRNSPVFALNPQSPPTLLEFGADSAAREDGNELYSAYQYLGVPSQFIVYPHTGHSIDDPRLRIDSWSRQIGWFDFWLLGRGSNPVSR